MTHTTAQRSAISRTLALIQHLDYKLRQPGADRRAIEARAAAAVREVLDALGAESVADAWALLTAPETVQM